MSIVFTNGVFDVLHIGHIRLLEAASKLGDKLIVGVNSDDSVRAIKGNLRPINNQYNRAEILRSIRYVNQVIMFNELTPLELISEISPDIIVKGGDYAETNVVGYGLAKIVIFPTLPEYSSTNTIRLLCDETSKSGEL